ncbi:MAG: ABC transporter ATP-binding protein [Planctomycetes bacterium]|nr:ABC transporter ATP-binding protein [Planctomycetota bacterium]
MNAPALETRDLAKRYGKIEALRGVSLSVEPGEIYGLLGQNGAGKTTLIKILLGITRNWKGEARLLGQPAGKSAVLARVGYLPEDHRFPEYHTGASLLQFYGQLLGVSRDLRRTRIPAILDTVGLADRMHTKIRGYSKGMKQRLGVAQALMHDPEVIFLDEPTDGVDPLGRKEIRTMILQLKAQNRTIFLNSHLLGEVELICDRVGILQKGRMVREGEVATLTRQKGSFLVGLAPGQTLPVAELQKLDYVVAPYGERWEIHLRDDQTIDPVVDFIRSQGLNLRHLVEKRQSLEDLFLETLKEREAPTQRPVPR